LAVKEESSFLKKKKQKTFALCGQPIVSQGNPNAARSEQKFLGSFFKKELVSSTAAAKEVG